MVEVKKKMKNKNSRLRFFSMLGNLEGMRENKSVTQAVSVVQSLDGSFVARL